MALGRPIPPVVLAPGVRLQLQAMTRSRSLSHPFLRRARIVLLAADGVRNKAIAHKVGISARMVGMWRKRFLQQGIPGLYDDPGLAAPARSVTNRLRSLFAKL